jgi:hypothetical protein
MVKKTGKSKKKRVKAVRKSCECRNIGAAEVLRECCG